MASAIRLSIVCFTLFGALTTGPGGSHTRGSDYGGRTPLVGPPVPTSGPVPSSAAFLAGPEGTGIVVGTATGATTRISRGVNGLPSPPLLPGTGVFTPPAILTNATRSLGAAC